MLKYETTCKCDICKKSILDSDEITVLMKATKTIDLDSCDGYDYDEHEDIVDVCPACMEDIIRYINGRIKLLEKGTENERT